MSSLSTSCFRNYFTGHGKVVKGKVSQSACVFFIVNYENSNVCWKTVLTWSTLVWFGHHPTTTALQQFYGVDILVQ